MLYLCISEGPDGENTTPVVATSDPAIIAEVVRALERRLGMPARPAGRLRGLPGPLVDPEGGARS